MTRIRAAVVVVYCACYVYFTTAFLPVLITRTYHEPAGTLCTIGKSANSLTSFIPDLSVRCSQQDLKYRWSWLLSAKRVKEVDHDSSVRLSTIYDYNKRISTLVKTKPSGYLKKCLDLLSEIESEDNGLVADAYTYTNIITAYASKGLARQAEEVLRKMERMGQENEHVRPSVVTYSSVLNAYAKRSARDEDAAAHAEAVLRRMISQSNDPLSAIQVKPNARCYTSVMDAWARNNSKKYTNGEAAKRAEILLEELKLMSKAGDESLKPTTFSYAVVITAWANSGNHKLSVQRVEALLQELEQIFENTGDADVQPNSFCYTSAMNAYAKLGGKDSLEKCEAILNRMVILGKSNPAARPNAYSYCAIMNAHANSGLKGSNRRVLAILNHMEKLASQSGDKSLLPTTANYNVFIDSCAVSGDLDDAFQAEVMLTKMIKGYFEEKRHHLKPNTRSFNGVLLVWSNRAIKLGDKEAPLRAEKILRYFERIASDNSNDITLQPDSFSYNSVLNALAKGSRLEPSLAREAEAVLLRMLEKSKKKGFSYLRPSTKSFGAVLNILARSRDEDAADRAEILLRLMEQGYNSGFDEMKPNVICYSAIINAWSKCSKPGSALRAERILNRMIESYERTNDPDCFPNEICFNCAMNCWAVESSDFPAEPTKRIELLLNRMKALQRGQKNKALAESLSPSSRTMNTLMLAHVKSGKPDAHHKCLAVLNNMENAYMATGDDSIRPDTFSFCLAIQSLVASNEVRKDRLVNEVLQRLLSSNIPPDRRSFNTMMKTLTSNIEATKIEECLIHLEQSFRSGVLEAKPNASSFSIVANAYAKERNPLRAEKVLKRLEVLYRDTGDRSLKPTVLIYNIIIDSWAKSDMDGSSSRAQGILDLMKTNMDVKPDAISYSNVIAAYARTDQPEAAEALFKEMKEKYSQGFPLLKPNIITFNSVINAWAQSSKDPYYAAQRAEDILEQMESMDDVKPDIITYTSVLNAWSHASNNSNVVAADRAEMLLQHMIREFEKGNNLSRPDTVAYNTVLKGFANSGATKKAEDLLTEMVKKWERSKDAPKPDRYSFSIVGHAYELVFGKDSDQAIAAKKRLSDLNARVTK